MAKVSIIIVNYNGLSTILDCLKSLERQTETDYEVIVVDNASVDGSVATIQSQFPEVKMVTLKENRGFTGGNIEGLRHATGIYICLLNPDTEVTNNWLKSLVQGMDRHPEVGICASKLLVHGSRQIDSAGDGCTTTGRGYKRGEGQNCSFYTSEEYIFGGCGGALLLRKTMIDQIGFLDDDFFLIYEDTDFNFRAQLAGWKCLFVPSAVVYHKVRSSIGTLSDLAVYYSIRNARFVWVKNMSTRLLIKYFHHHLVQEIGSIVYFCLKHQKWRAYFRANVSFLSLLPKMIKKRRAIMENKKVSDRELEQILTPLFQPGLLRQKIRKVFE
jgi:GT2 family glycosyltransferase